jgi:hypothetical protein
MIHTLAQSEGVHIRRTQTYICHKLPVLVVILEEASQIAFVCSRCDPVAGFAICAKVLSSSGEAGRADLTQSINHTPAT